ncbi:hypothetical protein acdb102_12980 [Acidothermaceae bacterium B102]|nr:hypothetical protein acdb102_12980 [Acidothermaceae bacterium B102]
MTTALGVFLVAVGAVLAFAVDATVPGIDLLLVGGILMLLGATGVALSMMRWTPRRRVAVTYGPRPVVRRTVHL